MLPGILVFEGLEDGHEVVTQSIIVLRPQAQAHGVLCTSPERTHFAKANNKREKYCCVHISCGLMVKWAEFCFRQLCSGSEVHVCAVKGGRGLQYVIYNT
jgi:hypothetical protein